LSTPPALRLLALAAVAVLAALVALALRNSQGNDNEGLPTAVRWLDARAAPYGPTQTRRKTACGQPLTPKTLGVAHPVLPCGVKIYIEYRGHQVLTQVIDRGPSTPGREFDITKALADKIELHGVQHIRWGFAR
jgi:Lytic transglycolase